MILDPRSVSLILMTKVEAKKTSGDEDDSSLSVVEFLREVEEPLKEIHLPLGRGKFIYTSLLGTAAHLSTSQNIKAGFLILLFHPDPDPNPDPDPDPDLDLDLDPDPDPDCLLHDNFFYGEILKGKGGFSEIGRLPDNHSHHLFCRWS